MKQSAIRRKNWALVMLIVDSSAVIAMMFDEPEASDCAQAIANADTRMISAVNYVETGTVLAGRAKPGERHEAIADLDAFLSTFRIDIAPLDETLARSALKARVEFGQGFGTRGGLNFGDCFAYALARHNASPLLYVGNDFTVTDVQSALTK